MTTRDPLISSMLQSAVLRCTRLVLLLPFLIATTASTATAGVVLTTDNRRVSDDGLTVRPPAPFAEFLYAPLPDIQHYSIVTPDYAVAYGTGLNFQNEPIPICETSGNSVFVSNQLSYFFTVTTPTSVSIEGFVRNVGGATRAFVELDRTDVSQPPIYVVGANGNRTREVSFDGVLGTGDYVVFGGAFSELLACEFGRGDAYFEISFDGAAVPQGLYEIPLGNPFATSAAVASGPAVISLLGGANAVGGLDVQFGDHSGGTISASDDLVDLSDTAAQEAIFDGQTLPPSAAVSDPLLIWNIDYTGSLTTDAILTLEYDDSTLLPGVSEEEFGVLHFITPTPGCTDGVDCGFVALEVLARNTARNQIVVATPSFSPFVVSTPEPGPAAGFAAGALLLSRLARRKRA